MEEPKYKFLIFQVLSRVLLRVKVEDDRLSVLQRYDRHYSFLKLS